jgi:hypothetical protein
MKSVKAINDFSCSLACLESVLFDNGVKLAQHEIIQNYKREFWQWSPAPNYTAQPGSLNDEDLKKMIELLGYVCDVKKGPAEVFIKEELARKNVLGILIGVKKGVLGNDNRHCYRVGIIKGNLILMDPSSGEIEPCEWNQILLRDATAFVIKKK